ncbi:hypothetical protein LCGC14_1808880 [marine sediment metagenome]|uniref:ParB-like N-terminal domain-containing protein n=1 Tax=marine sediment metagenome TaxID=412755 RepID=A0A0F9GM68_9ZZZZ
MSTKAFEVKEIKANPFRDLHLYPLDDEKIIVLRESIRTTGFWDNVVARINAKGNPELAYGHHRLKAVEQECGADYIVNLIIRDLSDTQMLQMMARENMEDWGTSFLVVLDTIRVTVKAFAEGRVKFDPVPEGTNKKFIRAAPSFLVGAGGIPRASYIAQTLGAFLGWTEKDGKSTERLRHGLNALELEERDCLSATNFDSLGKDQGYQLTTQTKKTYDRYAAKAKNADKEAVKAQKSGDPRLAASQTKLAANTRAQGVRAAQKVADTISDEIEHHTLDKSISARAAELDKPRNDAPPPDINRVIRDLARGINKFLAEGDKKLENFQALSGFFGDADFIDVEGLHVSLLDLSSRAHELAELINIKEHEGYGGTEADHSRGSERRGLVVVQ